MEPRVLAIIDTAPIISLEEQKLFTKVDYEVENTLIAKFVEAGTCACEKEVGMYFRQKRIEWAFDAPIYRFGQSNCKPVELPYGPNQIIESVTQVDNDGTETVLTTEEYTSAGYSYLRILPVRRSSLSHYGQPNGYLKVVYKAGYHEVDTDETKVWQMDEDIRESVRKIVAELYENRPISVTGTIVASLDITHKTLLAPYKRNRLF